MSKIVIFGATSAIAAACARRWIALGNDLHLVGRDQAKLDVLRTDLDVRKGEGQKISATVADLSDLSRHAALFDEAVAALGGMDVVFVAHGTLPDQANCEASVEETMKQIGVNGLSPISLATIAAQRFETAGRGTIAVISSVAGDRGRQSNYTYGAAKGMLSIFLEGLRNRLARHNVHVVTIKPGFVDTPMTAHISRKGGLWAQPDAIAAGIVAAVEKGRDVAYLPAVWWPIMFIIRHIPERIFKRLSL